MVGWWGRGRLRSGAFAGKSSEVSEFAGIRNRIRVIYVQLRNEFSALYNGRVVGSR